MGCCAALHRYMSRDPGGERCGGFRRYRSQHMGCGAVPTRGAARRAGGLPSTRDTGCGRLRDTVCGADRGDVPSTEAWESELCSIGRIEQWYHVVSIRRGMRAGFHQCGSRYKVRRGGRGGVTSVLHLRRTAGGGPFRALQTFVSLLARDLLCGWLFSGLPCLL